MRHPIVHRSNKELLLADLFIPGLASDKDLPLGPVFVYNSDKTPYGEFASIAKAASALNPTMPDKRRDRQIKIGRLMGLEGLVENELGNLPMSLVRLRYRVLLVF